MNKTILRNMRRFFMKSFNSVHNFAGKKKHRKSEEYISCIKEFALTMQQKGKSESSSPASTAEHEEVKVPEDSAISNGIAQLLGGIIYPKKLPRAGIQPEVKRGIDLFHQCLYQYSHTKLSKLLLDKNMAVLYGYYHDNWEKEAESCGGTFDKNRDVYVLAMQELREGFRSESVVASAE